MSGKNDNSKFNLEFVKGDLTDKEKQACRSSKMALADAVEFVEELVKNGYKMTISFDGEAECLMGVVLLKDQSNGANKGLMLSARALEFTGVCTVLYFKHVVKYKEVWPRGEKKSWGADI